MTLVAATCFRHGDIIGFYFVFVGMLADKRKPAVKEAGKLKKNRARQVPPYWKCDRCTSQTAPDNLSFVSGDEVSSNSPFYETSALYAFVPSNIYLYLSYV